MTQMASSGGSAEVFYEDDVPCDPKSVSIIPFISPNNSVLREVISCFMDGIRSICCRCYVVAFHIRGSENCYFTENKNT